MKLGCVYFSFAAFAVLIGFVSTAAAAAGDCAKAAQVELAKTCGSYMTSQLTLDLQADSDLTLHVVACPRFAPGSGDERQIVLLATGAAVPPTPPGYSLDRVAGTPQSLVAPACASFQYVVFAKGQDDANGPGNLTELQLTLHTDPKANAVAGGQPSAKAALKRLRAYGAKVATEKYGGVAGVVPGNAQGAFDSALNETLQILGQIVVDRASSQAYALIKDKLETLLGCDDNGASARGFSATCQVIVPLRIEDIAMSRDALVAGLAQDALAAIHSKLGKGKKLVVPSAALNSALALALLPRVTRPRGFSDDILAKQILDAILTYARTEIEEGTLDARPAQKVNVVATLAYLQCATPTQSEAGSDISKRLAACDIGANVDALIGDDTKILAASHALANELIAVATPTPKGGDIRVRLIHAVDALFANSCMLLREQTALDTDATPPPYPEFTCMDPETIKHPENVLALMQPIVVDVIQRDTNNLIASILHALKVGVATGSSTAATAKEQAKTAKEVSDRKRLFVLLGGLLNYAETYVPQKASAATASSDEEGGLHEQRTKILESLTRTMTDRTGRTGDCVWSLGGALQAVAAARIPLEKHENLAPQGPISLPLGLGLQTVGGGIHFMVGIVDLGQYVSWDSKLEVAMPSAVDALSPSVSLGYAWGESFPGFVAATAGYSPHYRFSSKTSKGSLNAGLTLGMYVPLLDIN
jgi:hypothetical protein